MIEKLWDSTNLNAAMRPVPTFGPMGIMLLGIIFRLARLSSFVPGREFPGLAHKSIHSQHLSMHNIPKTETRAAIVGYLPCLVKETHFVSVTAHHGISMHRSHFKAQ
jgi:hypothetical protein